MMPVVEKVLVHILLGQKLKLVGEMGDLAVSNPDAEWVPVTKLNQLVECLKIQDLWVFLVY